MRVALTFDDGPDYEFTPLVLDILKKRGVRATFYAVGQKLSWYPELTRQIRAAGHSLGSHSMTHADLTQLSRSRIVSEIMAADSAFKEVLGYRPAGFRPPFGFHNEEVRQVIQETGHVLDMWTVDAEDYLPTTPREILARVLPRITDGMIVLQHCSSSYGPEEKKLGIQATLMTLPIMIDCLRKSECRFVTMPELSGRPEEIIESGIL